MTKVSFKSSCQDCQVLVFLVFFGATCQEQSYLNVTRKELYHVMERVLTNFRPANVTSVIMWVEIIGRPHLVPAKIITCFIGSEIPWAEYFLQVAPPKA